MHDSRNDSYDFCEKQGYEVIIRFDAETESAKTFCRFSNSTECEAEAFMRGTCSPTKNTQTPPLKDTTEGIVVCTQNYDPVCGKNAITYSNSCIAATSHVEVAYSGVCIETSANDPKNPTVVQENKQETAPNTIKKDKPEWLNMITDLVLSEPPHSPPSYIDKCIYDNNVIVYYESSGCDSCYSALYNEKGGIMCYPATDTTKSCPSYFNKSSRQSHCARLWTDNR